MADITKDFDEVFARLGILGIKTQKDLADALGITQAAIADAKKRGTFPKGWAFEISKAYTRPVEWVLTGQGKESGDKTPRGNPSPSNPDKGLKEMFREIIDSQKEVIALQKEKISALEEKLAGWEASSKKAGNMDTT
jgi:hypothetical protein